MKDEGQRLETLCIHAGQHPDPIHGAVMTPIVLASTFAQKSPGPVKKAVREPTPEPEPEPEAAAEGGVAMVPCKECKEDIEGDSRFCNHCGGLSPSSSCCVFSDIFVLLPGKQW